MEVVFLNGWTPLTNFSIFPVGSCLLLSLRKERAGKSHIHPDWAGLVLYNTRLFSCSLPQWAVGQIAAGGVSWWARGVSALPAESQSHQIILVGRDR